MLVHVNDNLGHGDDHLAPGYGSIHWPAVLHDLRQQAFNGTLILELASRDGESVHSMLQRATEARHYLDDLMRRIA
jgi:sugar phosphate isomerase/epimerase